MYPTYAAPLPLLPSVINDDVCQHRPSLESVVYEGAAPAPANRLFEAKAVNLVQRPKTSTSYHRSPSSPGLLFQAAPR